MSTRLSLIVVAALALASLASVAFAAGYPSSAITLVIPLSPGDATDIVGRTIGEEMAKLLKVPVVPVNRPGGGMTIGIDSVVKAKKDGYTLLESPSSGLVASRILNPEAATYDPHKDLVALGRAARSPLMVTVRQDAPFKGFKDMAEFSKKNPGKVRVGTIGAGTLGHLALEMINSLTGAGLTMVPFKGGAAGTTALLGGHVEAVIYTVGALNTHIKSGSVRGVLISSRYAELRDVPTLIDLGYSQTYPDPWMAFYAPAGVPAEVPKALIPVLEKVSKDPAVGAKLAGLGVIQDWAPPERVLADLREEHRVLEAIARKAGLVK